MFGRFLFKKRFLSIKIFSFISAFLIIYNEYLVYMLASSSWKPILCRRGYNCTRMLFVADPQLLGTEYDKNIYNPLAVWDSDRYLRKTFQQALIFSKPDVIIYLGDLLDEGNIAVPDQYNKYVLRFNEIFRTPKNVKEVHIPGDNDIGGENGEYISNTNIRRFEIEFTKDDILDFEEHVRFFKINGMTLEISNPYMENNYKRIRIGLSHMPILQPGGPLQRNVINDIDPHVIFTAHWHDSRIFIYPSTSSTIFHGNAVKEYDLNALKKDHAYIEIMIPTCSYRMGKSLVGYGFAILENNNIDNNLFLKFSVYWSPSRFFYLYTYVVCIVLIISFYIFESCFIKRIRKCMIY